jgi:thymidylate synthase (FAD)
MLNKLIANYEVMLLNENSDGETLDESSMGIARELARMNLTLNTYTQWYWKIDLNNLLHFLALRADAHAQYEIRVYADIILDIVKKWVPVTYEAFEDYRVGGTEVIS